MKYIKTKRTQSGRTLIMTMVVIAVIGILAEVALLSYERFVAQEQVTKK